MKRMGFAVASTIVGGRPWREPPSTTTATSSARKAWATSPGSVKRRGTVRHGTLLAAQLPQRPTVRHAHDDRPRALGCAVLVEAVGRRGPAPPRHEHLDGPGPAALEQCLHFVGPARCQRANVLNPSHRVVRPVGIGRQLDQARLALRGPRPHGQAVAAHARHAHDGAGGQRLHHGP